MNQLLFVVFTLLAVLQSMLLPWLLLPSDPAWGWLLLPAVLLSNSWWAFIHETIHGVLFVSRSANRWAGRLHAIAFGASFDLLRWGHLLHHAYSRTPRERSEVFAGSRAPFGFSLIYYLRIAGGLYLAEFIATLLLLLPRHILRRIFSRLSGPENLLAEMGERLLEPGTLHIARIDALGVLLCHGLACWLYDEHVWLYFLLLAGRAFMISVVDNVFHYATALDRPREAKNLRLPACLSALLLHFNLHGVHHLRPGVSWRQLPGLHAAAGGRYDDDWWPALIRQWHGPIAEAQLRGKLPA